MDTEIYVAGQAVILIPKEELTRNSAPELSALAMHAATTHATVLIVSMRYLSTLPSEGLRVLITLHDMMQGNGKTFRICEGSPEIRYTLSITNLEQFFGYRDKLDAILEEYKTSQWEMSSLLILHEEKKKAASALAQKPSPAPATSDNTDVKADKNTVAPTPQPEPSHHATHEHAAPPPWSAEQHRELLHLHMPGRLCVSIVQMLIDSGQDLVDIHKLAHTLNEKEGAVRHAIRLLERGGILKPAGGNLYNYSPDFDLEKRISDFIADWHQPQHHKVLLPMVIHEDR